MIKLYFDPLNPETKKWTIYIPAKQYKEIKKLAIDLETNVNIVVSDSFSLALALGPEKMEKFKKEAEKASVSFEEYMKKVFENI